MPEAQKAVTPFDPRLTLIAAEARVRTPHVYHCFHARREMGAGFHVTAFAHFAGLEEKHVLAILAALEAHEALPGKRTRTATGTRLADDWQAPADWIDWACNERRWQPFDAREEAEIFANYWQAKSGQAAVKLDWRKTWMNWVRNSRRANGDYSPSVAVPSADRAAFIHRTIALYERIGGKDDDIQRLQAELDRIDSNVVPIGRAI